MRIIKEGKYPEGNKLKCEECGCEFEFYNTEIIVEYTTSDEGAFFGGFGVYKYIKCPTCKTSCTISCNFTEYKSIFSEIKERLKNLRRK